MSASSLAASAAGDHYALALGQLEPLWQLCLIQQGGQQRSATSRSICAAMARERARIPLFCLDRRQLNRTRGGCRPGLETDSARAAGLHAHSVLGTR